MSPDDPRHGTYGGYIAHRRDHEDACDACALENLRQTKAAKIRLSSGVRNRVPVGVDAHRVLTTRSNRAVSQITGLAENNLHLIRRAGPDKVVLRSTRDAILKAGTQIPTAVGVQRRLQGLSALGYTMRELAPLIGAHEEPLVKMSRRTTPPEFVNSHVAAGVVAVYDRLYMTVPPHTRASARNRTVAAKRGWKTPLTWDDIDDPDDTLTDVDDDVYIDDVVVLRLLAGEQVPSTKPERCEAMRRWIGNGRSEKSLCETHGWKDGRYTAREDVAS